MRPLGGTQSGDKKRLEHNAEHDHTRQRTHAARPFRRTNLSVGIQVCGRVSHHVDKQFRIGFQESPPYTRQTAKRIKRLYLTPKA